MCPDHESTTTADNVRFAILGFAQLFPANWVLSVRQLHVLVQLNVLLYMHERVVYT